MVTWIKDGEQLPVLGDNKASLSDALNLQGAPAMAAVARELAWRKARGGWRLATGHLPAEANVRADALSRLRAPEPKPFPVALKGVPRRELEPMCQFWWIPAL